MFGNRPFALFIIRAVYTRENKPRLTLNYLYEYKLPGQDKPRVEKAVNVDFVPFIRSVCVLCKPRPQSAASYFLWYKRPYCLLPSDNTALSNSGVASKWLGDGLIYIRNEHFQVRVLCPYIWVVF